MEHQQAEEERIVPRSINQQQENANAESKSNQGAETLREENNENASNDLHWQDSGTEDQGAGEEDQGAENEEQTDKNQGAGPEENTREEDGDEDEDSDDKEITQRRNTKEKTRRSHLENPDTKQYG